MKSLNNIGPIMKNVKQICDETDEIIDQYDKHKEQLPFKELPFNVSEYNKFKSAYKNYHNRVLGYIGEKRADKDLKSSINNSAPSNFYYKILHNVAVPFKYKAYNHNKISSGKSTQIDILLISNYGIYALEVKNYGVDQIAIWGEKTNRGKQHYETIDTPTRKYIPVPVAYIKPIINNKLMHTDIGNNPINHQTFIHKRALIEFVHNHLNINYPKLISIVHSPMIYAKGNIDKNGYNTKINKPFYLGNKVQPNKQNNWTAWRVNALPSKGTLNWIINNTNATPNVLSEKQVDFIYSLLKDKAGVEDEIPHKMSIVSNIKKFNDFTKKWNNYNKDLKNILYKYILETGIVKNFSPDKGYGFINSNKGDFFVHYTNINEQGYKTLYSDQEVSFDIKEGNRGPKAVNVTPISN